MQISGHRLGVLRICGSSNCISFYFNLFFFCNLNSFVQGALDLEKTSKLGRKMQKGDFDFDDFLLQAQSVKKMGGMAGMLKMIPGERILMTAMTSLQTHVHLSNIFLRFTYLQFYMVASLSFVITLSDAFLLFAHFPTFSNRPCCRHGWEG